MLDARTRWSWTRLAPAAAAAALLLGLTQGHATAQARPGGQLTVVHGSEPRSLNPNVDTVKHSLMIASTMLEPLVQTDETFRAVPGLAESWQRVDDRTWRFHLKKGVSFHNGEPFDATAVAFSIRNPGRFGPYFKIITDAVAVDTHTLEVKTAIPAAAVPALMTSLWVVPPEHYKAVGEQEFGKRPVGTGPFKFGEWVPGQRISVIRADRHWGKPAMLDRIVWKWAPEASARVALLETREADMILNLSPQLIDRVARSGSAQVASVRSLRKMFVAFNLFQAPFDDVRLRKAIAHAIDRDTIVKSIFGDKAIADPNVFNPVFKSAGGHGKKYLAYDPKEAQRILGEFRAVRPITLHSTVGRYMLDSETAEAVAGMLESVGLKVQRSPMEPGAFFNLLFSGKMPDMHFTGIAPLYPHEDIIMRTRFYSTSISKYCTDPALDKMADEALKYDKEDERARAYNRIEAYVLFEKVCWVPLFDLVDVYGVSKRVQGFRPRTDEFIEFEKLSIKP